MSIPELVLLVFQQASPWTWPTLCLLSRTCNEIVQPHVWKTVSCNTIDTFKKILPHIRKHADYVETLRINTLPESSVSDLVREISPFKALPNLTSLSIRHSKIPLYRLSSLLAKLPQLKEIVLQECSLSKNPLEVLAQCKNIESMAFNYGDILLPEGFDLSTAFSPWTRLRRLGIIWPDSSSDDASRQFQKVLTYSQLDLESLGWSGPSSRIYTILGVITRCPNLKRLALNNWDLPGHVWTQVRPSLANLRAITFHRAERRLANFGDRYRVFQACPLTQHVDLKGFRVLPEHFKVLAQTATTLTSLTLSECSFKSDGLRHVLDQCAVLDRLRVHELQGSGSIRRLFQNGPWACTKLQELTLSKISWSGTNDSDTTVKDYLETMWETLSKLSRLRVLTLCHCRRTDTIGLGIHWFGAPSSLEKLCLTGHVSWTEQDLAWITEHLPWLDELEYSNKEMKSPLQSWLKKNRSDVRMIVSK